MATGNHIASPSIPPQVLEHGKGYNKCYRCKTNICEKPNQVCDACKAITIQRKVSKLGVISQTESPGSICKDCGEHPALGAGVELYVACQVARRNKRFQALSVIREQRGSKGLCKNCGRGPPEGDSKNCKKCKENFNKSWGNKHDGTCPTCGSVLLQAITKASCVNCRARKAQYEKRRRDKARKEGMYIWCQTRPRRPGRSMCESCFEYHTNWRHYHMRKQTGDAQKPDQTVSEVDQEIGDDGESFLEDLQSSEEQDHLLHPSVVPYLSCSMKTARGIPSLYPLLSKRTS